MSDSFLREDGNNAFDVDEYVQNGDICSSNLVNVIARASNRAHQQYTKRFAMVGNGNIGSYNSFGLYAVDDFILDSSPTLTTIAAVNLGSDRLLALDITGTFASTGWGSGNQFILFTSGPAKNIAFALDSYGSGKYRTTAANPSGLLRWDNSDSNTDLFFPTISDSAIVVENKGPSGEPNDRVLFKTTPGVTKVNMTFGISRRYYLNAEYGKGIVGSDFDIKVYSYASVGDASHDEGTLRTAAAQGINNNINRVIYRGQIDTGQGASTTVMDVAGTDSGFSNLYGSSDLDGVSDLATNELVDSMITFIESDTAAVKGISRQITASTATTVTLGAAITAISGGANTVFEIRNLDMKNPLDEIVEYSLDEPLDVTANAENEFAIYVPFDKNVHWVLIEEVQQTDRELQGT
jgi:hypothetical protein